MKDFTDLYECLDATTSTNAKIAAMVAYFKEAPSDDSAWALFFLTGRRLLRFVPHGLLREWLERASGIPDWLFQESYSAVGDLAETIALLLPKSSGRSSDISLSEWMQLRILPLKSKEPDEQFQNISEWWKTLPTREIFILNKFLTGSFRVGVSETLVIRALAEYSALDVPTISHRLMGKWEPTASFFESLVSPEVEDLESSRPYPFYLASPLDHEVNELGQPDEWQMEWKWDGIRSELVRRKGQSFLWSRGEDLITERFPEIAEAAKNLPDGTVLDGEVLSFAGERPAPFSLLQRRIGRKKLNAKILEEIPIRFVAYDLLELDGVDLRDQPLKARRDKMIELLSTRLGIFQISQALDVHDWNEAALLRSRSRELGVEGLMIKRKDSVYRVGRKRGDWWKWKVDPFTIDAVLLYAQPGSGRRSSLYTDYTFGIWRGDEIVPIAKAYSGLSDSEIRELDRWIRQNTIEKFGPVRSVKLEHVFELAFEGIAESPRHKSGFALRFPRISRWRKDKPMKEADTTERVSELLKMKEAS